MNANAVVEGAGPVVAEDDEGFYEARDFLVSVGRWYAEDGAVHGPWPEAVPSELGPLGARAEAFFAWGKEWRPRMLAELLERQRHASVVARHAGSPSLAKVLN